MFSLPIDKIEFAEIDAFCAARPREGLVLDYKRDFPSRLDKAMAMFANTYGGHILIGVDETATGEPVLPITGIPLMPGLRERVVATALDAILPPLYPEVKVVEFRSAAASGPGNDRAVVLVRVQESDSGAHAVDGGTSVYLRVDNISQQFSRKATVGEIEWLSQKRQKSVDLKEQLIGAAEQRARRYLTHWRREGNYPTSKPRGKFRLWAVPRYPRSELASPQELMNQNRALRVQVPSFTFPFNDAAPVAGGIRYPNSPVRNFYYTEVNRFGLVYSEVGFAWEDETGSEDAVRTQTMAALLVALVRFALKLYENYGFFGLVDVYLEATPTLGKYPLVPGTVMAEDHLRDLRSLEDIIVVSFTGSVKELQTSITQRAISAYQEFCWAFGWNVPTEAVAQAFTVWGLA